MDLRIHLVVAYGLKRYTSSNCSTWILCFLDWPFTGAVAREVKLVFRSQRAKKKCSISTPFWKYIVVSCKMTARLNLRYIWLGSFFYKGFQSLQTCKIVDPPYFSQGPFVIFLQGKIKILEINEKAIMSAVLWCKNDHCHLSILAWLAEKKSILKKNLRAILTPRIWGKVNVWLATF